MVELSRGGRLLTIVLRRVRRDLRAEHDRVGTDGIDLVPADERVAAPVPNVEMSDLTRRRVDEHTVDVAERFGGPAAHDASPDE